MTEWFYSLFDQRTFGAQRSPLWPQVRKQYLLKHPTCEACGTDEDIECHHLIPVHVDRSMELRADNLIALCSRDHLLLGHLNSFKSYNKHVRGDAAVLLDAIKNRP